MDNSIILNTKKFLGRKQVVLDCKFQIDSGKEVQKVLGVSGNPILTDTTITNGNINYLGKVNLKLIYLTENNDKESLTCIADFNEFFDNEEVDIGDFADIDLKVVDVTTPSIKANEVKVACILDSVISVSKNKNYEQIEESENIFYKKSLCEVSKQVASFKDNFDLSEEFRIEGDLKSVLNLDVSISTKECYSGNGFVVLSGDANVNILYEDESDEVKLFKTNFKVKQEVLVDNVNKDCLVLGEIKPLDYLEKCIVVQGENCNIIKWEVPVAVNGVIYVNNLIDNIDDCYSTQFDLVQSYKECETISNLVFQSIEDTVKGEVPFKEDINATFIGYLFSGVEVSSSYIENDKLTIEGVVSTTILYKNNDNNLIQSVIAEFPYISQCTKPEFVGIEEIKVQACILDMDIVFRNNVIDLVTKLQFNVFGYTIAKINLLNDIQIGEPKKKKDCAMEILIVNKEQTFWELGKTLGISCEQLLLQNPKLVEPVQKNEKIIVYYNYKN